jgi:hypothetical protein
VSLRWEPVQSLDESLLFVHGPVAVCLWFKLLHTINEKGSGATKMSQSVSVDDYACLIYCDIRCGIVTCEHTFHRHEQTHKLHHPPMVEKLSLQVLYHIKLILQRLTFIWQ